jgi:hypothetical protein
LTRAINEEAALPLLDIRKQAGVRFEQQSQIVSDHQGNHTMRTKAALIVLASLVVSSLQLCTTGTFEIPSARAQEARLHLENNPGDRGTYDVFYSRQTSIDFYATASGNLIQGNPNFVAFLFSNPNPGNANTFAFLRFQTSEIFPPVGLTPGTTYENVQHYAVQGTGVAGMDISFQNRASSFITGQFTINSLSLLPDRDRFGLPQLAYFFVTFTQYGGISQDAPDPLRGTLEYSATTLPPAPEPSSLFLVLGTLGAAVGRGLLLILWRPRISTKAH